MTSLRKQLATINAKSTNELDLRAQKAAHAKSLLFDPKVAANQSLDVIYQLCHEGFEELCALDSRFILFEKSIFSQQSRTEDRLQMTQKENEELDAVLESFLGLVGARLLLKPAIKAVEWLIRRFRVLESNTESLVLTFLPYHATPIFTTLLSILPKQLPSTLKFLHPYMAQLANPPRGVIVFSATRNAGFFAALNRYVLNVSRAQHTYHILLSFWASTVAQTINDMLESSSSGRKNVQRQREEDLLTRILRILDEGLGIRNVPELTLGCYMLIAVLVSKASLSDRTLDELMVAVSRTFIPETADAALGCLAIIAEQRQVATMPNNVLKMILMKIENIAGRLEELATQQPVQKLTISLFTGVLTRASQKPMPQELFVLKNILESSVLDSSHRDVLLQQASTVVRNLSQISNGEPELSGLVQLLENQQQIDAEHDEFTVDPMEIDSLAATGVEQLDSSSHPLTTVASLEQVSEVMETTQGSFLSSDSDSRFQTLLVAFEQLSQTKDDLQEILNKPFLQNSDDSGELAIFSFFMRVWTSSRSKLAKCRSLRLVTERLTASNAGTSDLQAIIPYALYALSDPSKDVRRNAASLLAEVDRHLNRESRPSHGQNETQWAQALYASQSNAIKWLSNKTAGSFVNKVLGASLEECVSDADYVGRLIQNGLDSSQHTKSEENDLHRDRLKASQRTEVFTFLCSHVTSSPVYSLKLRLLSMLNRVEKIGSHSRSKFLLPSIQQLASVSDAKLDSVSTLEHIQVDELNTQILEGIHQDDQDAMEYLLKLTHDNSNPRRSLQIAAFRRLRQLWPHLKRSKQRSIIETLLDASLNESSTPSSSMYRDESLGTLRSIRVPSEVLVTLMEESISAVNHRDQPPASKKRRTSAGNNVVVGGQETDRSKKNVTRLTLVLELVDGSRGEASLSLLYSLFKVLQALQDYRAYTTSDLGYLQNLALGSLSNTMKELDRSGSPPKIDGSQIRIDLLVDSVRNTTTPQARNLALLLLADLTKYTPQAILQSIMPIFTLMSATTLQQTDEFSAHVVDQTIEQVVPLLSQTLREQKKDLAVAAAEILLSFAAAFEHIAPHRRLQLYAKLASSLGVSESLFAMLATLSDRFPGNTDVDRFSVSLFRQFGSKECLTTINKYLDLVLDCLQPKPGLSRILLKDDDSQGQSLTRLVVSVPNLLKDPSFRTKLAQDLTNETEAAKLRILFGAVLEQTIRLSQTTNEKQLSRTTCTRLLEALLNLFPLQQLVQSIQPLLDHVDLEVTRSVIKTLELRVKTMKNAETAAKAATMSLLPRLSQMLRDQTRISLKPNVLACIDQICEKFGKTDLTATLDAVQVIASDQCVGSADPVLRVLSLHCLASSVEILQHNFSSVLRQADQAAISCLHTSIAAATKSAKLHNAAYAFFTALVDHVPYMISRASLRAVLEASNESAMAHFDQQTHESRTQFLHLAATRLELKTVLEVSGEAWGHAVEQGLQALQEHVDMLKAAVENHSKTVISGNARILFDILLAVLDLRRTLTDDNAKHHFVQKQLESLEGSIISVVIAVVLKINDATFRPFFSQLLEWSSTALPKRDTNGKMSRSITVFNLISALSERLKSIFTVYFGYTLDRANELLKSDVSKESSAQTLKLSVIRALSSSFKYDQDDFWQAPAHFDAILEPLISQLSIQSAAQVNSDVIPAITELAAAAASNDHHKDLNRLLLKTLKDESPRVRLAAVKCQESLARRLGDEWLGHLPEMLPVINELQDDDDEGVERETHKWIKLIEDTLGESLNSMLQ